MIIASGMLDCGSLVIFELLFSIVKELSVQDSLIVGPVECQQCQKHGGSAESSLVSQEVLDQLILSDPVPQILQILEDFDIYLVSMLHALPTVIHSQGW